jgi:hypothetical protein
MNDKYSIDSEYQARKYSRRRNRVLPRDFSMPDFHRPRFSGCHYDPQQDTNGYNCEHDPLYVGYGDFLVMLIGIALILAYFLLYVWQDGNPI